MEVSVLVIRPGEKKKKKSEFCICSIWNALYISIHRCSNSCNLEVRSKLCSESRSHVFCILRTWNIPISSSGVTLIDYASTNTAENFTNKKSYIDLSIPHYHNCNTYEAILTFKYYTTVLKAAHTQAFKNSKSIFLRKNNAVPNSTDFDTVEEVCRVPISSVRLIFEKNTKYTP